MNEMFDESGSPSATETESKPVTLEDPSAEQPSSPDAQEKPPEDPTLARFKSCRWHATQDDDGAPYCSNRDVLPFAGRNGFKPEAWCPDCKFFKVRRTVKKRNTFNQNDY